MTQASALVGAILAAAAALAALEPATAQRDRKPPAGKPPGPTWLAVGSDYPTDLVVRWTAVPNASTYRIWRWNDGAEKRFLRKEVAVSLVASTDLSFASYADSYRIRLEPTYSYQVEAVYYDAAGVTTVSGPSPVGSARSARFLAPANLRASVSPNVDGESRIWLTFDPVPAAASYYLSGTYVDGRRPPVSLPSASVRAGPVLIDPSPKATPPPGGTWLRVRVPGGRRYSLCLSTIYPRGVRDDTVRRCVPVET